MKVAIIFNQDQSNVINKFGIQNKEIYNPRTIKLVADSLEKTGHNVRVIDGDMNVIQSLQEFMPRVLEGERMGMVFNMAYGIQGESRYTHLPSIMEMLGIPYVGSNPGGHALALDKVITKIIMQKFNIPTPDYWVFSSKDDDMSEVYYPVIVKPKMEAVSFGLRIVENMKDLKDAVEYIIHEFKQPALVEQFIAGREFAVGLLGNGDPEALPVLEIDLEKDPRAIQTSDDKKKQPRGKICPADIPEELANRMIELSKQSFNSLGLYDFARVDIRMDNDNNIYLLEVNSMASLGKTGSYVYAANVAGYDYKSLVNKILDVASVRYFADSYLNKNEILVENKNRLPLIVRIRGFIKSRVDKTEKIIKDMVNINTYVRNVDGVNSLGQMIGNYLNKLGFNHHVVPQVEVGNIHVFSNSFDNEYDVLLLGHLDNSVPFTKHKSYRETSQRLYGTGIWENKGGLAIMINALQTLSYIRIIKKIRIGILLITDNSLQGRFAQQHIREISAKAKVIIGLNGSSIESSIITSRSGASAYDCQMNIINAEKVSAVTLAASRFSRLITSISDLSSEEDGLIVIPRDVEIKTDLSKLYASGEAAFSVRFNSPEQAQKVDRFIRGAVKKIKNKSILVKVEGGIRRPPMSKTPEIDEEYNKLKRIASQLDIRLLEEHRWSSSDISVVEKGKSMIDGIGPVGMPDFDKGEYILRHSIQDRVALLTLFMSNIIKDN